MARSVLVWIRHPPYSTNHLAEAIRASAMASALDLPTRFLFTGDGVWALVREQEPFRLGPPPEKVFQGILTAESPGLVARRSLESRSIAPERLVATLPLRIVGDDEMAELLLAADTVVPM